MLARAFARHSNLLVLDEPTNDLDLETLDVLQERLGDYAGAALIVSHDRDFLDRVVSAVIVPEGEGSWGEYAGGYTEPLARPRDPEGGDRGGVTSMPRHCGASGGGLPAMAAAPRRRGNSARRGCR